MLIVYIPNVGTDEAVGGADSTKISSSTRKLPNRLIAVNDTMISWFDVGTIMLNCDISFCLIKITFGGLIWN